MFRQAVNLKQALEAGQKTVYVQIATADLEMLKADGFKLCFAKKVGDAAYNVVWQSYTAYLMLNSFSWQSVPVEKVLIWFQKSVEAGTMFINPRPNSVEVDMSTVNQAACRYANGRWQVLWL